MTYIITGFGKFGRLAYDALREFRPDAEIAILEHKAAPCEVPSGIRFYYGDAVKLMHEIPFKDDDIVIPTVPFHFAARFLCTADPRTDETDFPKEIARELPNPLFLNASNLVCSEADFLCPDNCPAGPLCTVTGEPHDPLYETIRSKVQPTNGTLHVLRSRQILPGIGGYTIAEIKAAAEALTPGLNIIATACRCHGILTALQRTIG
jgi:hypothetical protein